MKKTYATPGLVANGEVIQNTKISGGGSEAPVGEPASAGRVGFYL